MRVAVRHAGALVDTDGHVVGHDAGATLVRRLLRLFPGAVLVGPGPRHADGFDLVPLEFLDPAETVVVTMDVLDSFDVWRTLRASGGEPRLMNFVWWSPTEHTHDVERAALGLACSLFPTFANSERTAAEVRDLVARWAPAGLRERAPVAWADLGIRLEHVRPRHEPDVPVVLYPAIWLTERKQPQVFRDVVGRVARQTPVRVEVRLHESHLVTEEAMALSLEPWAWVGPLTATRRAYWEALARTTAFLATATDESYGLMYVEALVAGAVGVLPDRPWARALLPDGYPFLYRTTAEAERLLLRAVTETAACRRDLDACAGGDFADWLRARHDDDRFEDALAERVREWFGPTARLPRPAAPQR